MTETNQKPGFDDADNIMDSHGNGPRKRCNTSVDSSGRVGAKLSPDGQILVPVGIARPCDYCGRSYVPKRQRNLYCSKACKWKTYDQMHPRRKKGGFHFCKAETSPRLQRVLKCLRDNPGITSGAISRLCDVLNPAGVVSELRANGFTITAEREERTTANGRVVWRYRLDESQETS